MTAREPTNDESIRQAVLQAFAEDGRTTALGLRVGVLAGIVHLGGNAPSARVRHLAEVLYTRLAGVRGVANRIQVPGAPAPARTIHVRPVKGPGDRT